MGNSFHGGACVTFRSLQEDLVPALARWPVGGWFGPAWCAAVCHGADVRRPDPQSLQMGAGEPIPARADKDRHTATPQLTSGRQRVLLAAAQGACAWLVQLPLHARWAKGRRPEARKLAPSLTVQPIAGDGSHPGEIGLDNRR
jgi:hypothetical protein